MKYSASLICAVVLFSYTTAFADTGVSVECTSNSKKTIGPIKKKALDDIARMKGHPLPRQFGTARESWGGSGFVTEEDVVGYALKKLNGPAKITLSIDANHQGTLSIRREAFSDADFERIATEASKLSSVKKFMAHLRAGKATDADFVAIQKQVAQLPKKLGIRQIDRSSTTPTDSNMRLGDNPSDAQEIESLEGTGSSARIAATEQTETGSLVFYRDGTGYAFGQKFDCKPLPASTAAPRAEAGGVNVAN